MRCRAGARSSNKGDFGRVLIVGGGIGMPGAVRLAGEACLRVGAGLVTVAVAPENVPAIAAGRPELICLPLRDAKRAGGCFGAGRCRGDRSGTGPHTVGTAGPECGSRVWSTAGRRCGCAESRRRSRGPPRDDWILTPHPGEAGRLLGMADGCDAERSSGRPANSWSSATAATIVLKGAGTLVGTASGSPALCERGNPGMATAGMGDVLTGAIAGILAQCRDTRLAARVGVLVHAMAGDAAARSGERGLLASDVTRELHNCVNL